MGTALSYRQWREVSRQDNSDGLLRALSVDLLSGIGKSLVYDHEGVRPGHPAFTAAGFLTMRGLAQAIVSVGSFIPSAYSYAGR
jgi:hypothetical protein